MFSVDKLINKVYNVFINTKREGARSMLKKELTLEEKKQADKLAKELKTLNYDKLLIVTGFVTALKTITQNPA